MSKNGSHEDPNAHLHNELYYLDYESPLLDHHTLFFTRNRPRQSLDGEWRLTLDRHDEGLRTKWFELPDVPADQWRTPPDFSLEGGRTVTVPGCINLYDEKWDYYEGPMWFSKVFDFMPRDDERVFLHVGAAANTARVFLNGKFLGKHLGASTPFCVELPNLKKTRNILHIVVDNTRRADAVPMHRTDWFNYGGIYRSVSLFSLPKVFIADFRVAAIPGSNAERIRIGIDLSDPVDGAAEVAIPGLNQRVTFTLKKGKGEIEIDARAPVLWSPKKPHLYLATARFGKDFVSDRVGFREISVKNERIHLNGEPIWLRGICAHEEYPGLGKAADEGVIREMFRHARELGCNYMRLAHYPHHELAAQLADELGIMLWEEIPVYWAIDWTNPATRADAENQLREMIKRDMNRASVIIWGVGNENKDSDERLKFMSHLADTARAVGGGRLVSAACLVNHEKWAIEDRLAERLDVIGINEYFGWYEPDFEDLTRLLNSSKPGKPVLISETGADSVIGFQGGERELFSENWQMEVMRQQIERLGKADFINGMTPWILYDFRSERRQNQFQRGYNRKGLIDQDHRRKKRAFDVVADFYRRKACEQF